MTLSRFLLSTTISIIFLFLLSGLRLCDAQFEGDACMAGGARGSCSRLENCPSVYEELLKGNPPQSMCGYLNFEPIVCCPRENKAPVTSTTSTTTTTTTTTTTPAPVTTTSRRPISNDVRAKARAKCEEYASSVYVTKIPPTLAINKEPVNISLCAIKTRKLIVGGDKAEPKEYPHMAAIGFDKSDGTISWLCGGTLISERFVLTAAHCTYNVNVGNANWVRLGDLNLVRNDDDARPEDYKVIQRITHPKYKRPSEYHDIALLKLERNVRFNAWIRPSCLSYSLPDTGTDGVATATGWGQVDWAGDQSNDLLKVTISLVPQNECNRTFTQGSVDDKLRFGIVDTLQICAGELGKDTCQGDSGGPLVILNKDYNCMYSLIGVTSLGKLCGSIIPGVYTRVYSYVPWIEQEVWP